MNPNPNDQELKLIRITIELLLVRVVGRKHTEETKQKLREASRRHREKGLSGSMLGKKHSDETKRKMSRAQLGKRRSTYPWYVGSKVYSLIRSAKNRKIAWDLTQEQACELVMKPCVYCGQESQPVTSSAPGWNLTGVNGIDRIDNTLGYTLENSATACPTCNIAKAEMSIGEFRIWIKKVNERLKATEHEEIGSREGSGTMPR